MLNRLPSICILRNVFNILFIIVNCYIMICNENMFNNPFIKDLYKEYCNVFCIFLKIPPVRGESLNKYCLFSTLID